MACIAWTAASHFNRCSPCRCTEIIHSCANSQTKGKKEESSLTFSRQYKKSSWAKSQNYLPISD